jgi:hypothetical protein
MSHQTPQPQLLNNCPSTRANACPTAPLPDCSTTAQLPTAQQLPKCMCMCTRTCPPNCQLPNCPTDQLLNWQHRCQLPNNRNCPTAQQLPNCRNCPTAETAQLLITIICIDANLHQRQHKSRRQRGHLTLLLLLVSSLSLRECYCYCIAGLRAEVHMEQKPNQKSKHSSASNKLMKPATNRASTLQSREQMISARRPTNRQECSSNLRTSGFRPKLYDADKPKCQQGAELRETKPSPCLSNTE